MREKLRIGLINPCGVQQGRGLNSTPLYRYIPPQSLIQLKSVTPEEHEVTIIDENQVPLDWNQRFDLVGITGATVQIARGYEIADQFRRRGIPVVMGGPHVTFMTEEALLHCDSVVRREADEIWAHVLEDAANGRLKRLYDPDLPENLDFTIHQPVGRLFTIATPRPLPQPKIMMTQPQRGCPYGCQFCSVTAFNGTRVRQKSVGYVIEELKRARSRFVICTSDNITVNRAYAKELFKALIPLRVSWLSQTDIHIADDEETLDLAVRSGLKIVMIGFEDLDATTLGLSVGQAKKAWRERYEPAIEKIHRRGIMIQGGFMFGLDHQTPDRAREAVEWAVRNKIAVGQFTLATPLPGTELFRSLHESGRILSQDWTQYSLSEHCVIRPTHGDAEMWESALRKAYDDFYSFRSKLKRMDWRLSPLSQVLWWVMQSFRDAGPTRPWRGGRRIGPFLRR